MTFTLPKFLVIDSSSRASFSLEWEECLQNLEHELKNHITCRCVKLNIFTAPRTAEEFMLRREKIKQDLSDFFQANTPPYSVIPQKPCTPGEVVLEATLAPVEGRNVVYHKWAGHRYAAIKWNMGKEIWFSSLGDFDIKGRTDVSGIAAYSDLIAMLEKEGMNLYHVLRQWNYIGGILDQEETHGVLIQNYQLFNSVRHNQHQIYKETAGFPAATGIGMTFRGMQADAYALLSGNEGKVTSITNPRQQQPNQYSYAVLNDAGSGIPNPQRPPQFERAKLVSGASQSVLYISGTAAITGENTVATGDVQAQTHITLENIGTLAEKSNLLKHCPTLEILPVHYIHARVYIKNAGDLSQVQQICSSYFGEIPVVYLQADICRHNLLVEIEAEKSS